MKREPEPAPLSRRALLARTTEAALQLALVPFAWDLDRRGPRAVDLPPFLTDPGDLIAHLDAQIPRWLHEDNVPGLSIGLIHQARLAWLKGFGVKDKTSSAPVTPDTMFEAASMSKPVFAYVVMKLCETGVLDLDKPLTAYTSTRFLEGDPRLDLITPRHILSHTGGFQNWRSEKEPLAIQFAPGTRFLYSGEGYNYLQTVLTSILKQPFETYMTSRLLAPFGMTSSGYVWNDMLARRMARPHNSGGAPIDNKKSSAADVARYGSAGALLTTPADYANFVIEVINPKPADAVRLTDDSLREMLRPHVKIEGGRYPASCALGWQVFHNSGRDYLFHGGDNEGFHCAAVASVAGKSGFVAMTNGENGTVIMSRLITDARVQNFLAQ